MIKPETIPEIIGALEYLKREFERNGKIDIINMIHVYDALRMVDHARQPSAIREAAEGEREACAKIADRRADSSNKDCERLSFDGSTGTLECSLSHRGDCLCQEHQEEAEAIAAAIRARGEEKDK